VETAPETLPSLAPLPAPLREEGGVLWWSAEDCRAGRLELSSGAVEEFPGEHCRLWPSPDGSRAVAVATRRSDALAGRGLVLLPGGEVLEHTPGFLGSEVAWAPDGAAFAVCIGTRDGTVVDFVQPGFASIPIADACFPGWHPYGSLALVPSGPAQIVVEGKTLLGRKDVARLLPTIADGARRAVSAVFGDARGLAVALVVVSDKRTLPLSAAVAVMSPSGETVFTAFLGSGVLPTAIALAPDGRALSYFDAGTGEAHVLLLPDGRVIGTDDARWLAWSPDGLYLAAATARGIVVTRWPSGEEVAVVPVRADDVAWTRAPAHWDLTFEQAP